MCILLLMCINVRNINQIGNFLLAIGNDKAFLRQQKNPSCFTIVWIFNNSPVISNENRFASVQFSNTMTGVI